MHIKLVRGGQAARREDSQTVKVEPLVEEARAVFLEQSRAIADLARRVDQEFAKAVQLLYTTTGHVVTMGIGKSGVIARKIAATFASMGSPSFFVHAAEAFHGDLGMITDRDTAILISNSGETEEVVRLLPHLAARAVGSIAIVGHMDSTLSRGADVTLDVGVRREVCPNDLAPTTSTLAALAMGDALSVAVARLREFKAEDFARLHPGGSLARRLLTVREAMQVNALPLVSPADSLGDCMLAAAEGKLGMVVVVDGGLVRGTVSESELRYAWTRYRSRTDIAVSTIMNRSVATIDVNATIGDAQRKAAGRGVDFLVVTDPVGRLAGVLRIPS